MMDCLFCKIVNGQAPAEIIYKDDKFVVFKDINPKAPIHLLIVPKKHIQSLNHLELKDKEENVVDQVGAENEEWYAGIY